MFLLYFTMFLSTLTLFFSNLTMLLWNVTMLLLNLTMFLLNLTMLLSNLTMFLSTLTLLQQIVDIESVAELPCLSSGSRQHSTQGARSQRHQVQRSLKKEGQIHE